MSVNQRKLEHLNIVMRDKEVERGGNGLERFRLLHRAFPEIDLQDVDTRVNFLGKSLRFPLLISSMTGGDDERIRVINRNLAQAAEHCQVAMAVGSQRVMMREKAARESFELRSFAPTTVLIANLGAVQLNYGYGIKECRCAVDTMAADGLYLHLNPLQEAIQPEGETNFANLAEKVAFVNDGLNVPVLLKEVGSGLSLPDIELGMKAGIRHFDISGFGGTSWSRIEYHRRLKESDDLGLVFQDWGMPMADLLKKAYKRYPDLYFIASGGVRSGIDMVKSVILGAQLCGMAAPFLKAAEVSVEAVIERIERIEQQYRTALFLLGCKSHEALHGQINFFYQEDI